MKLRPIARALAIAVAGLPPAVLAADIVLTPPAGGGVSVTNAAGTTTRLRVADDGIFTLPGIAAAPLPSTGMCVEIATGRVGTCSVSTLTSITAGTGLSGGTITTSGTIELAPSYMLPQRCASGQMASWNEVGSWICATPSVGTGTVSSLSAGSGITLTPSPITTTGTIAADTTFLQRRVSATCAAGSSIRAIAADGTVTCQAASAGAANAFVQGGNAFGAAANLGTADNREVNIVANNARVARFEPTAGAPNLAFGHPLNVAGGPGVIGASVGGGGGDFTYEINSATGNWATVAGGHGNRASNDLSTISGGNVNLAGGHVSTVGGGNSNTASGDYSNVGGGDRNVASGYASIVAGGQFNVAGGDRSFAAGWRAMTQSFDIPPTLHHGAFVWADNNDSYFNATASNEFSARATGGVRFVTAIDGLGNPTRTVSINPNGELSFGSATRQMLNLWGSSYAIGVQSLTHYSRTDFGFAWHRQGVHSDTRWDPGAGGELLMTLQSAGDTPTSVAVYGIARAQTFASTSDRNAKDAFEAVDGKQVLASLVGMPLHSWKYRNEGEAIRHIGPTAQDFRAAFGVGYDDKTIATVDADGVALAAIQGLHEIVAEKDRRIGALERERETQRDRFAELEREREAHGAEIASLKAAVSAIPELRREMAIMARLLDRLEREVPINTAAR